MNTRPGLILSLAFAVPLLLTGCVSREAADKKLAKGCEAAIKTMLTEAIGREYKGRGAAKFSTVEGGLRQVALTVKTADPGSSLVGNETFTCRFSEDFSFMKLAHHAEIQQLKIGDAVYGKDNGVIVGDIDAHARIGNAVADAMDD